MAQKKEVIIRQHAFDELFEAFNYYAETYSNEYAERFRIEFYEQVDRISGHEHLFPECRFLTTKTRIYRNIIWGNYLIIYKINSLSVDVLSLFHTKRNPSKLKRLRKVK